MANSDDKTPDTITAVLVDDEPLARELLRVLVERDAAFSIVAECNDGRAAIDAIISHEPDVVFLDIEMPRLDGVSVVQRLAELAKAPYVVFVTAFNQYAIKAFELNAVDYLVKPLSKERCREALQRVREEVRRNSIVELTTRLMAVASNVEKNGADADAEHHILLRKGNDLFSVPLSDIVWVEAANQYVNIHTVRDTYLMSESLSQFEGRLSDTRFVRIHRSAIVNGTHVTGVTKNKNGTHDIRMQDGSSLRLARARAGLLPKVLRLAGEGA